MATKKNPSTARESVAAKVTAKASTKAAGTSRKTASRAAPKPVAKPVAKPAAKKPAKAASGAATKPAPAAGKAAPRKRSSPATGEVLKQLKSLAKDLNKAAKDLSKSRSGNPKAVSTILGNVERMTAEAATKSLYEAESAKLIVAKLGDSLGKDWSRRDIEGALKAVGGHLTNIIVAQEFQDLAGQSIRQAMKALVGAIIVTEAGGPTEEGRLSQNEVDSLLKDLMP